MKIEKKIDNVDIKNNNNFRENQKIKNLILN